MEAEPYKMETGDEKPSVSRRDFLKTAGLGAGAVVLGGGLLQVPALPAMGTTRRRSTVSKPSQINLLYATVEANSQSVLSVVPDYKSAFGFPLKVTTMPYNALEQKVFAELAAGSSYYDVIIMDVGWYPALIDKIEPISAYIQTSRLNDITPIDLADFIPKVFYDTVVFNPTDTLLHYPNDTAPVDARAILAHGFEIWGLPIQANALTMSYRTDLFNSPTEKHAFQQKYGRPLEVPVTWDDFVTVAEFFTRPGQRLWGTTLMAGTGDWATDDFKTLLACWGGDGRMISDHLTLDFDSALGVDALTFYVSMIQKDRITPPGTDSASWDTVMTTFDDGLSAMSMNYHTVGLQGTAVNGKVDYALVPKKVRYGPHFGTWALCVNKASTQKPWAYRTISWLTSAEVQKKMLATQLHPTRRSVFAAARTNPTYTRQFGHFYDVLGKSLEVGVGRPRLKDYPEVDTTIWTAVNNAARGVATPSAALRQAAASVRKELTTAGYHVPR